MSEFSSASPRCPKCFAQVSEEAARCPACSFDFSILEQPRAAAKPAAAAALAIPVLAEEPLPVLAPQAAAAPPAAARLPRPALEKAPLPLRRGAPPKKIAAARSFDWARAALFLGLIAVVSLMGVAGLRIWAVPGSSAELVMDAPIASGSSAAENPFPQRVPDAVQTQAALALAGLFSAQLQAMNRAF
ncbi:MAG: hypothetical protein KGI84_04980 [Elusimicrobia bacterium]|nr:hypothetical protein [Elusimicrobiota bacterium]